MAGLLDFLNTDQGRMGLGLLAAAGPRTDGAGFGQRLQEGMGSFDAWKDRQQQSAFQKMQMDNYASEIEQRKAAMQKQALLQDFLKNKLLGGGGSGAGLTQKPDTASNEMPGVKIGGVGGSAPKFSPIPASGNAGGLGSMSLDDITALHALGGPDLLNSWKVSKEGFERKPGTFYESVGGNREYVADPTKGFNQDGTLNPNFVASQRTLAEIPEAAKANLDLVEVPNGDGTTRKMPRADAVRLLRTADPVPSVGQRHPTPQEAALIAADAKANNIQNPFINLSNKSQFGQTQSPLDAGRVKNINEAGGKINDTWLKSSYEPALTAGTAAQGLIDNTVAARGALKAIGGGGWGTEMRAAGANVLAGLGIASDNAKMFAANAQVFQSKAMDRLWSMLNEAKGSQTEGDADRASKTWASLKNTPQANEYIMDLAQAKAEREKMKASFFKNALPIAQSKGDLSEVEREWDARMPSIFEMPTMKRWAK